MQRGLAFGLVLVVALLVRTTAGDGLELRSTGMALGFALIAAALVGDLFERIRLPRVSGYLLFGLACGPYVLDIITRPMARELQLVNGLAVALIAFIAGLELNLNRMRARLAGMVKLGVATMSVMYAGLFVIFWIAWPWLPIAPDLDGLARAAIVALIATIVVSFSPTVTIAVIAENRARGPFSELVIAVVVLGDLLLILFFTLVMQFARWALGTLQAGEVGFISYLSWEIFGSFAFGAALGAIFSIYLSRVGRELTLVLLALCIVLSEIGGRLHFEPLLAALAAGLVVENVSGTQADALRDAVERGALPVLVLFFVAAGASLHVDALAAIGLVALVIAAARLVLIQVGCNVGARMAGIDPSHANLVWRGLVSQAGVTLGLTIIVVNEFPGWGLQIQTLMVALIAIHELAGPVLFRTALVRSGEVGRLDTSSPARPEVEPAR